MNIVVFTKNWLGDVIFETPALRAIKENFPDSHLVAVTSKRCVEILEVNPHVDEVISFDEKETGKNIFARWRLVRNLKKRKIDRAYLFHRSITRAKLACRSGIKERIGYDTKKRGKWLTCAVPEPEGPIHDVQYFLDLLRASGHRVENGCEYEFHFTPNDLKTADALLREYELNPDRLVAINAGANWIPKRWPPSHFRELAHRLVSRFGVQIVLTGSAGDSPVAREILNHGTRSSFVSLTGKTTVRELGALYTKCRLVISNDTGPLHIASAVGTNVLGLFGPTASRETAPLGRGRNVIIHYFPEGVELPWVGKAFPSPWMELISVETVLETIEREKLLP
ncbi:MAG: lipopolysaccharide heptosyltransferase II [Candidatus Omnitrophica bacterium]|nr:lipopolysaccharide heptosyltransferase II [Candidatus Omnitrophota bacterium]